MSRPYSRRLHCALMLAGAVAPFATYSALAKEKKHKYVVVDLGVLDGGDYSIGNAINNSGVVVGMATATGGSHAVKLEDLDLTGLASNDSASSANDINKNGQAVGYISSAETSGQRATLWHEAGETDLGTLGGPFSIAHGINDKGDVVGQSTLADGIIAHGFLWHDGALADLGTLGGEFSIAKDINAEGLIAGLSTSEPGQQPYGPGTKAVLWGPDGMIDLGALGGDVAAAAGINSKGWVVGGATTEKGLEFGGPGTHAFVWKNDTLLDLGAFDGADFSNANAINKDGQIVGFAGNPYASDPNNSMTATLWEEDGTMVNLNEAIDLVSGWFLVTAMGINDKGQITGLGITDGQYRGFLLEPVD